VRKPWTQNATPSPISVGRFSGNAEDGWSLFQHGAYYSAPNSLVSPARGTSVLSLEFGSGQRLSLDFGGFHSLGPAPPPEEP
jgi:hypothetical protein